MVDLSTSAGLDRRPSGDASMPFGGLAPSDDLSDARIVVVDDEPANVRLVERILEPVGYSNVVTSTDPRHALPLCEEEAPDLVLLDLVMPYLDGFELYEQLSEALPGFKYVPVLFLTADESRQARETALSIGGQDFLTKPLTPREVRLRVRNLLTTRMLHLALQRANERLDERVRQRTAELEDARVEILERLALAAEYRDDQTGEHTRRVGQESARLARVLGLGIQTIRQIRRAAPLHDVGKIGIHDSILLKPGELTPEEFAVMETHTVIGADILSGSHFPVLQMASRIARSHHEYWDGTGYPDEISGEEIPLPARIVSVVDVFDSLTHDRVYKEAWTEERALEHLHDRRGTQFDPEVANAYLELRRQDADGQAEPPSGAA